MQWDDWATLCAAPFQVDSVLGVPITANNRRYLRLVGGESDGSPFFEQEQLGDNDDDEVGENTAEEESSSEGQGELHHMYWLLTALHRLIKTKSSYAAHWNLVFFISVNYIDTDRLRGNIPITFRYSNRFRNVREKVDPQQQQSNQTSRPRSGASTIVEHLSLCKTMTKFNCKKKSMKNWSPPPISGTYSPDETNEKGREEAHSSLTNKSGREETTFPVTNPFHFREDELLARVNKNGTKKRRVFISGTGRLPLQRRAHRDGWNSHFCLYDIRVDKFQGVFVEQQRQTDSLCCPFVNLDFDLNCLVTSTGTKHTQVHSTLMQHCFASLLLLQCGKTIDELKLADDDVPIVSDENFEITDSFDGVKQNEKNVEDSVEPTQEVKDEEPKFSRWGLNKAPVVQADAARIEENDISGDNGGLQRAEGEQVKKEEEKNFPRWGLSKSPASLRTIAADKELKSLDPAVIRSTVELIEKQAISAVEQKEEIERRRRQGSLPADISVEPSPVDFFNNDLQNIPSRISARISSFQVTVETEYPPLEASQVSFVRHDVWELRFSNEANELPVVAHSYTRFELRLKDLGKWAEQYGWHGVHLKSLINSHMRTAIKEIRHCFVKQEEMMCVDHTQQTEKSPSGVGGKIATEKILLDTRIPEEPEVTWRRQAKVLDSINTIETIATPYSCTPGEVNASVPVWDVTEGEAPALRTVQLTVASTTETAINVVRRVSYHTHLMHVEALHLKLLQAIARHQCFETTSTGNKTRNTGGIDKYSPCTPFSTIHPSCYPSDTPEYLMRDTVRRAGEFLEARVKSFTSEVVTLANEQMEFLTRYCRNWKMRAVLGVSGRVRVLEEDETKQGNSFWSNVAFSSWIEQVIFQNSNKSAEGFGTGKAHQRFAQLTLAHRAPGGETAPKEMVITIGLDGAEQGALQVLIPTKLMNITLLRPDRDYDIKIETAAYQVEWMGVSAEDPANLTLPGLEQALLASMAREYSHEITSTKVIAQLETAFIQIDSPWTVRCLKLFSRYIVDPSWVSRFDIIPRYNPSPLPAELVLTVEDTVSKEVRSSDGASVFRNLSKTRTLSVETSIGSLLGHGKFLDEEEASSSLKMMEQSEAAFQKFPNILFEILRLAEAVDPSLQCAVMPFDETLKVLPNNAEHLNTKILTYQSSFTTVVRTIDYGQAFLNYFQGSPVFFTIGTQLVDPFYARCAERISAWLFSKSPRDEWKDQLPVLIRSGVVGWLARSPEPVFCRRLQPYSFWNPILQSCIWGSTAKTKEIRISFSLTTWKTVQCGENATRNEIGDTNEYCFVFEVIDSRQFLAWLLERSEEGRPSLKQFVLRSACIVEWHSQPQLIDGAGYLTPHFEIARKHNKYWWAQDENVVLNTMSENARRSALWRRRVLGHTKAGLLANSLLLALIRPSLAWAKPEFLVDSEHTIANAMVSVEETGRGLLNAALNQFQVLDRSILFEFELKTVLTSKSDERRGPSLEQRVQPLSESVRKRSASFRPLVEDSGDLPWGWRGNWELSFVPRYTTEPDLVRFFKWLHRPTTCSNCEEVTAKDEPKDAALRSEPSKKAEEFERSGCLEWNTIRHPSSLERLYNATTKRFSKWSRSQYYSAPPLQFDLLNLLHCNGVLSAADILPFPDPLATMMEWQPSGNDQLALKGEKNNEHEKEEIEKPKKATQSLFPVMSFLPWRHCIEALSPIILPSFLDKLFSPEAGENLAFPSTNTVLLDRELAGVATALHWMPKLNAESYFSLAPSSSHSSFEFVAHSEEDAPLSDMAKKDLLMFDTGTALIVPATTAAFSILQRQFRVVLITAGSDLILAPWPRHSHACVELGPVLPISTPIWGPDFVAGAVEVGDEYPLGTRDVTLAAAQPGYFLNPSKVMLNENVFKAANVLQYSNHEIAATQQVSAHEIPASLWRPCPNFAQRSLFSPVNCPLFYRNSLVGFTPCLQRPTVLQVGKAIARGLRILQL